MDGAAQGPSQDDVADEFARGKAHTLIPGAESAPAPQRRSPSAIAGAPGAAVTLASAIPATVAGNLAGVVKSLFGGKFGTPEGTREGAQRAQDVSRSLTYEPSPAGGEALDKFGHAFEASKLAGLNPTGPVAGAGNAANIARGATAKTVTGANAVADALEATRTAKRAAMSPEALAEADVVRRAQAQGYKTLPVQTNSSAINHVMESIGGKVKTEQNISIKNQPVTNRLSKEGAGVAATEAATPEELAAIRKEQGAHYDAARGAGVIPLDESYLAETGALSSRSKNAAQSFPGLAKDDTAALVEGLQNPALEVNGQKAIDANHAIDMIGILREQADSLWSSNKTLAKANRKAADALEGLIERHISDPANGVDPALVENFRNARTKIAKTYDVESAVNPATMNVSARALARRDKGGKLTGELKDVSDFARTQEKAVQRPEVIGGVPAGSIFDLAIAHALPIGKGALTAGLVPLARATARATTASTPYQKLFVQPKDYAQPGLVERIARSVAGEKETPPKKFGNEIDPSEFLRSLRIGKGEAVDEAIVDRALQAEALKKRHPPASLMNDFQWLAK